MSYAETGPKPAPVEEDEERTTGLQPQETETDPSAPGYDESGDDVAGGETGDEGSAEE